ncbi:hypothetical protein [Oerskovia enterophila]
MGPTKVFFSMYGRVLTVAVGVVGVMLCAAIWTSDGAAAGLRTLPGVALVTWAVAMLFWLPRVEVSDGGIDVHNVVRSVHVPWPAFEGAETRWSLEVSYRGGTVSAWAAPRSSGSARWLRTRRDGTQRGGGTAAATAETVAAAVAERHAALVAAGYLDARRDETPGASTRWNVRQLAVLGALVVATIVVTTVGG